MKASIVAIDQGPRQGLPFLGLEAHRSLLRQRSWSSQVHLAKRHNPWKVHERLDLHIPWTCSRHLISMVMCLSIVHTAITLCLKYHLDRAQTHLRIHLDSCLERNNSQRS